MRSGSLDDRRYLLYDPIMKMKVTTQGEEVINLMWDVIAAKGFEKDTFFEMAARDIRALPKLEGTVHVNIALISKFMKNFLFVPKDYPEIEQRSDAADDEFLFQQGPTGGLGTIQFHDFNKAFDLFDLPNIKIFKTQINIFKESLIKAPATEQQMKDIDVMLTIGEMFTLVPYAQLILESAKIMKIDQILINQIFDCLIRDFSKFALEMYSRPSSTELQMEYCMRMIQKPEVDFNRTKTIWSEYVYANVDAYEMNP